MIFPYSPQEPISLTNLKNKLFSNFYKFLTSSYNYLSDDFLEEYSDIRVPEPKREANKIPFELSYELAKSTVDDIKDALSHFKVATVSNAPFSEPAPEIIAWGPMGSN